MNRSLSNIINLNKMRRFIANKLKDENHYTELSIVNLEKPITILLGPNGTGKSRSLENMKYELKYEEDLSYVMYSTSHDDIVKNAGSPFSSIGFEGLIFNWKSEGERMIGSFQNWCREKMLREILSHKKELYIFIDEADSGLSIDRLKQSLEQIKFVIEEELKKGRKIHLIATCNSYEMYEIMKSDITETIWIPTKDKIELNSYEEFKSLYTYFFDKYYED